MSAKLANALLLLGCEDKCAPGKVSAARVLAYAWGISAIVAGFVLVDPLVTLELLGAALTALGLRKRANPQ